MTCPVKNIPDVSQILNYKALNNLLLPSRTLCAMVTLKDEGT